MHPTRDQFDVMLGEQFGARLAGRPDQGIYAESAIQNFLVGSRRIVRGGWVLHYCQISKALGTFHTMRLAGNGNVMEAANEFRSNPVAAPAGQNRITIADNASPLNYYENGLVECWHGGLVEQHRVKSSTATDGTNVTITLYDDLLVGLDIADGVSISPSPYRNVAVMGATGDLAAYQQYVTAVGLPLFDYTDNYFAWIVTWGAVSVGVQAGHGPDEAVRMKDVYCHPDGTIADKTLYPAATESPQRVGYGLPAGAYGHSQIMLQLDP